MRSCLAHLNWGRPICWGTVLCLPPLLDIWGTANLQVLGTLLWAIRFCNYCVTLAAIPPLQTSSRGQP